MRFPVLHVDPPWSYATFSREAAPSRAQELPYTVMTLADIKALAEPINAVAEPHAVMFLWVIAPLLHASFDVLQAWGWQYKTVAFTWVKQNRSGVGFFMGMGYYSRKNPEYCLLATRGKGLPRVADKGVPELMIEPVERHSRKPDETYRRIARLYPGRPYLDIFARERRAGWSTVGYDLDGLDITESLARLAAEPGTLPDAA